ncbi:MAG: hypothetical protein SGPRY_014969, partial [Prymnesium sp.]
MPTTLAEANSLKEVAHSEPIQLEVAAFVAAKHRERPASPPLDASSDSAVACTRTALEADSLDCSSPTIVRADPPAVMTVPEHSIVAQASLIDPQLMGALGYHTCREVSCLRQTGHVALEKDPSIVAAGPPVSNLVSVGRDAVEMDQLSALRAKENRLKTLLAEMYAMRSLDRKHLRTAREQLAEYLAEISSLQAEILQQSDRLVVANAMVGRLAGRAEHLEILLSEVITCSRILLKELRHVEQSAHRDYSVGDQPEQGRESPSRHCLEQAGTASSLLELIANGCRRPPKGNAPNDLVANANQARVYLEGCFPGQVEPCTGEGDAKAYASWGCEHVPVSQDAANEDSVAPDSLAAASTGRVWAGIEKTAKWLRTVTSLE